MESVIDRVYREAMEQVKEEMAEIERLEREIELNRFALDLIESCCMF